MFSSNYALLALHLFDHNPSSLKFQPLSFETVNYPYPSAYYSATPQSTCSTPSQSASTPHLLSPHPLPSQASHLPLHSHHTQPLHCHHTLHSLLTLTGQQPPTLTPQSTFPPPMPHFYATSHVNSTFSVHTCHIHTIHLTPMVTSVFVLPNGTVLLIIKTVTVRLKVT